MVRADPAARARGRHEEDQPAAQREQDGAEPYRSGRDVRRISQTSSPALNNGTKRAQFSKASGYTHRSFRPDPVRYLSVTTATHRPAVTDPDTWRDKKETARRAAFPQPRGRFRRWWQVLGSNQRRLSRRFYRPLLRATLHHHLPAQTSPDWFRHGDAVRYMYMAAGCRAADPTDSHVQARCRSQETPKPAGRSTGRNGPFQSGRIRADPNQAPATHPRTSEHTHRL